MWKITKGSISEREDYELNLLYLKNRTNIPPKMAFTQLKDSFHHEDQYLIECALTQNSVRFYLARTT